MIARVTTVGQSTMYGNVIHAEGDERGYIILNLSAHPHRVYHWRSAVLLAATPEDMTAMLREEAPWCPSCEGSGKMPVWMTVPLVYQVCCKCGGSGRGKEARDGVSR